MPVFVRKQYFDGLVQPVIDYECVIWGEWQPRSTIKGTQNSKNVCQVNDGYMGQKINTNNRVV